MGWQWYQLDHMQIICTLLQTDNHTSSSPLSFYRLHALLAAVPTTSKQINGKDLLTRMWANAQRDGRPVEYRWRPVLNAAVWLAPTARLPCSNAANGTVQDLEDAK